MQQYLDLMRHVRDNGVFKEDRTGTGTVSTFGYQMRFNLQDGFPLVTTKKIHLKSIIHELIWFLAGDTNIKYLVDNDVHIWDDWAIKEENLLLTMEERSAIFQQQADPLSYSDKTCVTFANLPGAGSLVKENLTQLLNERNVPTHRPGKVGDLGPVYGGQWRGWEDTKIVPCANADEIEKLTKQGYVLLGFLDRGSRNDEAILRKKYDQITDVMNTIKNNPDSRRIVVSAWNVGDISNMKLPPCHALFQFYAADMDVSERIHYAIRQGQEDKLPQDNSDNISDKDFALLLDAAGIPRKKLSCQLYQRSCDIFLGVPFNIASYALLTHMLAQQADMAVGDFIWTGGDCHLYSNHKEQVDLQLSREPMAMPKLKLNKAASIFDYKFEDFEVIGYASYPGIKAPVAV